ncbi:MAG: hypothetical protein WCD70_16885, partial [Alphaproteobacteria bacterium]
APQARRTEARWRGASRFAARRFPASLPSVSASYPYMYHGKGRTPEAGASERGKQPLFEKSGAKIFVSAGSWALWAT